MHIAFFNRSYYPDQTATGQLLTELAETLVGEHGCRVTVVTGPPLSPAATTPGGATAAWPPRETRNGVCIVRARGTRFNKRRFAGRAANYMTYFASACVAGVRLDRPDVVVALTDPPVIGIAAWIAGRRAGAPLVMAFKDLFPEVAALLPDFHSPAINGALQAVNRWLVQRAALNIALSETMRRRLIEDKGAPPDRTVIIPDWADTTAIEPGAKDGDFARHHGFGGRFVVMHSGNLGLSQNLETIVEAAAILRSEAGIVFVFQGEGVKKADLQALVAARGLTNVLFLRFAPAERLADSFASADVFIVSLQRGLAGYIVPSKLYGILAAGRPFVAAVEEDCEVASLARTHACGLVAEPGDARQLADRILTYYRDRAGADEAGGHARRLALTFDRRVQVARYAEALRELQRLAAQSTGGGRVA